jgi:hypothetical protein
MLRRSRNTRRKNRFMSVTKCCFSASLAILLLLRFSGELKRAYCQAEAEKKEQNVMKEKADEELIAALGSRNVEEASEAVQEVIKRGEHMIPLLMRTRGNMRVFNGCGLGHAQSSQLIFSPTGSGKFDEGRVITVEVAALYLISAVYYGKLSFAQSPYLTDLSLPPGKRKAFNSRRLIAKAWASVKIWGTDLEKEGLESLRFKQRDPLRGSGVSFW